MPLRKCALVLCSLFAVKAHLLAASFSFTTINFPNATDTELKGINNNGEILGTYSGGVNGSGAFLLGSTGFGPPLPGLNDGLPPGFFPGGINNSRMIVGSYPFNGSFFGFALGSNIFGFVGPGSSAAVYSSLSGINDQGEAVGTFAPSLTPGTVLGFSDIGLGSGYATIDVPGSVSTQARAVNNQGEIVGSAQFGISQVGYLLGPTGYSTFSVPGADTYPEAINDLGQIVGTYILPSAFFPQGFLLEDGVFTTIDFPGAAVTELLGINDSGQIIGSALTYYSNGTFSQTAFIATATPEPSGVSLSVIGFAVISAMIALSNRRCTKPAV